VASPPPAAASIRKGKEKLAKLRGAVWGLIEHWGQMFKFVTWMNSKMRNRDTKGIPVPQDEGTRRFLLRLMK